MNSAIEVSFAEELLAAARPHPMASNPFLVPLRNGTASPAAIRRYAIAIATTAIRFPRVLGGLLAVCDDTEIRKHLLGNLLEEEGVVAFRPGEGVILDPARGHAAMALRFARAAGATAAELDADGAPPSRWYRDAIAAGDWAGALAYFAVGYEANVPETFRIVHAALVTHYGFADDDLEFLTEHMTADERHGRESAGMLASLPDPRRRERAREGARRGGMAWWMLHSRLGAI